MAFRQKGIGHDMVPQNPNADKTILFADDDGQLPKFVAALLTRRGYNLAPRIANRASWIVRAGPGDEAKIFLALLPRQQIERKPTFASRLRSRRARPRQHPIHLEAVRLERPGKLQTR
jgi:hypothetical protein